MDSKFNPCKQNFSAAAALATDETAVKEGNKGKKRTEKPQFSIEFSKNPGVGD